MAAVFRSFWHWAMPIISLYLVWAVLSGGLRATSAAQDSKLQSKDASVDAGKQPDTAAQHYLAKRLPEGETELPVERYLVAHEQLRRMPQYAITAGGFVAQAVSNDPALAWQALGPGNFGGRTRAFIIHPSEPQTMWAGAASGGVWKTVNGGAAWVPLGDQLSNLAVNALALDRNNPNVLYAGTGEGFLNAGAVRGAGIFQSLDGGTQWARLPATGTADFYYVNDLAVSPANSQRLYAATGTGVWRSLDSGASWVRVLDPQSSGGCLELALHTEQDADVLFASCGTGFFVPSSVYRNGAAHVVGEWEKVLSEPGMGRTSLAIAPSDPRVVYAAAAVPLRPGNSGEPGLWAIFRSTSSGAAGSWTAQVRGTTANGLNKVLFSWVREALADVCGLGPARMLNTGWYANALAVDPLDAQRVWLGGVELFRSDDGGVNWGLASSAWAARNTSAYASILHHALVFHPQYDGASNRTLFATADGGIYKTIDARAVTTNSVQAACNPHNSAVTWMSLNHDYAAAQLTHGAPYPAGTRWLASAQGQGLLRGSETGGINGWEYLDGVDGGSVALDATNPEVLYAATTVNAVRKSTDGGRTFAWVSNGIQDGSLNIAPFVMDSSDSQRLWIAGTRLWQTTDGGARWLAGGGVQQGAFSALAVAPTDSNVLQSGANTGQLFGAATAQPRSGFVSGVTIDPVNPNVRYATYSTFGGTHVWRSLDGGATWNGIDGNGAGALPDVPVHCLVVDPLNRDRLFIGTDVGVFVTLDGGAHWAVATGLPKVVTETLVLNRATNPLQLFAFTYGRGAWRATLGGNDCRLALMPGSATVKAEGGNLSVAVTGASGCPWTASINPSGTGWLQLTGNTSGSGIGIVNLTVEPNTGYAQRFGTLQIAGRSFNVTQPAKEDQTPPIVQITSPAANGRFTTSTPLINLSGTVSDDVYVAHLTLGNERGGQSEPLNAPSAAWSFNNVRLWPGLNQLTVTATDLAGRTGNATLAVLYTPAQSIQLLAGNGNYFPMNNSYGDGGPALAASIAPQAITMDAQGHLFIIETARDRLRKMDTATGVINHFAGGGPALGDGGPATQAFLSSPRAAVADAAGNVYIADWGNHRVRRVAPNGVITTITGTDQGGFSGDGGPAVQAQIYGPVALALDRAGNLYIADDENRRVRKVALSTGIITTVAGNGSAGFAGDGGPALAAQLNRIRGLAVDAEGNLYISDASNHSVRRVAAGTGIITRYAGLPNGQCCGGGENVPALEVGLREPSALAVDAAGDLLITQYIYGVVLKVARTTGLLTTVVGGATDEPFTGAAPTRVRFFDLQGIALDPQGNLVFAERFRVWKVWPFVIDDPAPLRVTITNPATATYQTSTGGVTLEGTLSLKSTVTHLVCANDRGDSRVYSERIWFRDGRWMCPMFLAPGPNRLTATVFDVWGNRASATREVNFQVAASARTLAGMPGNRGINSFVSGSFSGDGGAAVGARLNNPSAVAVDAEGSLYIADTGNNRVRKITPAGIISTLAGTGLLAQLGDGGPAMQATLNQPRGVTVDAAGNVYIADTGQHRIRKVTPAGIISTVAGAGVAGFAGDGGPATAAQLNAPLALALDAAGNLYISDTGNHRVRKVTSTGIISSVVGGGYGYNGDGGPAAQAQLKTPRGVVVDAAGNLFVADADNYRIRKIAPSGIISTVVGTGEAGGVSFEEPALSARLTGPSALALDAQGRLYFTDIGVYQVGADGIVRHLAGDNVVGPFRDDGGPASSLLAFRPPGLALDQAGNLYIADPQYHRVVLVAAWQAVVSVHAASYSSAALAPEAIVAAFGSNLATTTQAATSLPLPPMLGGTSVRVRDSQNVERLAPLFFVSPTQLNYQIPAGTANGLAVLLVSNGQGSVAQESIFIETVAPGLFSANSSGQGVAAATLLRVRSNGAQSFEPVAIFDPAQNRLVTRALSFGDDQLYLILFGTGLRQRPALASLTASVGGEPVEVLFAGAQGSLAGLDQINLALPRSLAGRGEVDVVLTIDGKPANPVRIHFAGTPCSYQVAPLAQPIAAAGGTLAVNISTAPTCFWRAQTNAAWLTPATTALQSGARAVNLVVAANPSPLPRTAELRLAGQAFTLTQLGAGAAPPSLGITNTTQGGLVVSAYPAVTLRGTASAGSGLALLLWINERGGNGQVYGTTNWVTESIPLQPGLNKLTVIAYDTLGRRAETSLNATFQPEFRIETSAGGGNLPFSEGRRALDIRLPLTDAVAVDALGQVYFTIPGRILKLRADGTLVTLAGNGMPLLDPGPENVSATAIALGFVGDLALDRAGNLYYSEYDSYERVRKVEAATGLVTTVAGSRTATAPGDGGPAIQARLQGPYGLALDTAGNLYIAERGAGRVRKVAAATGLISTVAGNGNPNSLPGDGGPATAANLGSPLDVALDGAGNLFILAESTGTVRRVSAATGLISTFAGGGTDLGEEVPAITAYLLPRGLAIDAQGNLLLAVYDRHIRRVSTVTGRILTIAGGNTRAYGGDGGPAIYASMNDPGGLAVDASGNVYIADTGNGRIRKLTPYAQSQAARGLRH